MRRGSIGAWVRNVVVVIAAVVLLLLVGERIGGMGANDQGVTSDEHGNVGISPEE